MCLWRKAGGMDVHISQIPGLSPTMEAEDRARGRRSRIHDSDSDYIKLAKQGGHKGTASTCESISITLYYLRVSMLILFFAVYRTFVARGHIWSQSCFIQTTRLALCRIRCRQHSMVPNYLLVRWHSETATTIPDINMSVLWYVQTFFFRYFTCTPPSMFLSPHQKQGEGEHWVFPPTAASLWEWQHVSLGERRQWQRESKPSMQVPKTSGPVSVAS